MGSNFCAVWLLLLVKVTTLSAASDGDISKSISSNLEITGEKSPEFIQNAQMPPISIGDHIIFQGNVMQIYKASKKRHARGGYALNIYGVLANDWKVRRNATEPQMADKSLRKNERKNAEEAIIKNDDKIKKRSEMNLQYTQRNSANDDGRRSARMARQMGKNIAQNQVNAESFSNIRDSALINPISNVETCPFEKEEARNKRCGAIMKKAKTEAENKVEALRRQLLDLAAEDANGLSIEHDSFSATAGISGLISEQ